MCSGSGVNAVRKKTEHGELIPYTTVALFLGSFSNDNDDGKVNGKKVIGFISKKTTLHVHHPFLYISLPSPHVYDLKMPNSTFYGGRKEATTNFFSLSSNLSVVPNKSTPRKCAYI